MLTKKLPLLILLVPVLAYGQVKDTLMERALEKYQGPQQAQVMSPTGTSLASGDEWIYDRIRNMIKVNDPGYFIGYATNNNLKDWPAPHDLRPEEGANGYIMELRLAQRFPTIQSYYGRKDWLI